MKLNWPTKKIRRDRENSKFKMQKSKLQLKIQNWQKKKLGEICEFQHGFPFRASDFNINGHGLPVIRIGDIEKNKTEKYYDGIFDSKYLVDYGDILIGLSGTIIAGFWHGSKALLNQRVIKLINFKGVNKKFLYYTLPSKLKTLSERLTRSAVKNVLNYHLYNLDIPLPSLLEQQKIVYVLDSIQAAVGVQEKIIEKTKELKKSLMQKLFREGTRGAKLKRTEIGEIPENWEVVKVRQIAEVVRGGSPRPKGDRRYFSESPTDIHWITIADLTKYKKGMYITNTDEYLTEEGKSKSRYLEKGSFVLTNSGTVGIPGFLAISGCIHDGYLALLDLKEQMIQKIFLYYYFEKSKRYFEQIAPKGTQANLNTLLLKKMQIPLPSLSEQREIAEILHTIDQKIEIEQKKKALYEELFKTMLNKLMTGEIRVNNINFDKF